MPQDSNSKTRSQGMNRRHFLRTTGATLAGLSMPVGFTGCVDPSPDDPPPGIGTVSIARGNTIEDMVFTAIEMAGGLEAIQPGETVVIKPNMVATWGLGGPGRSVTHPEVLRAVIRAVKERTDASNITVAEAPWYEHTLQEVASAWGHDVVIEEEGVTLLGWERASGGEYVDFYHDKIKYLAQPVSIPATLSSFDHFINVPVLKNHRDREVFHAVFTICLKNFVGVLEPMWRGPEYPDHIFVRTNIHWPMIGYRIAEIGLSVPNITMNIVDAVDAVLSGGPRTYGDLCHPNLILASKDRVACDTVGVAVLRTYARYGGFDSTMSTDFIYLDKSVFEWDQIRRACQIGLGRRDPAFIEIVDSGVDNIDDIIAEWV
jgi:uncharacterized protein (DUF362 family)